MSYHDQLAMAFNEGSDAWLNGTPESQCPYDAGAKRWHWLDGWRHCERNYPRDRLPAGHQLVS